MVDPDHGSVSEAGEALFFRPSLEVVESINAKLPSALMGGREKK
jgi:hypothetical protein